MGSASRRWTLNLVIHAHGQEMRDEVAEGLPKIVRLVLEGIELRPGDTELLADAVITDLDGTEARLAVASFTSTNSRSGIRTLVHSSPSSSSTTKLESLPKRPSD